jgi:hypothetical protein
MKGLEEADDPTRPDRRPVVGGACGFHLRDRIRSVSPTRQQGIDVRGL